MDTGIEDDITLLQTQLKALEYTPDQTAKELLLQNTYRLRDGILSKIPTISDEYKRERLMRQLLVVDKRLKKHDDSIKERSPVNTEVHAEPRQSVDQRRSVTTQQVLEEIVRSELSSRDVKLSEHELEEVLTRLRTVKEVQEHLAEIVEKQGEDLSELEMQTDKTLQKSKDTNKELDEANSISIATRIMKIRLLTGGVLAALGSKFLGFFGMIGGLLAGFKIGSALKH